MHNLNDTIKKKIGRYTKFNLLFPSSISFYACLFFVQVCIKNLYFNTYQWLKCKQWDQENFKRKNYWFEFLSLADKNDDNASNRVGYSEIFRSKNSWGKIPRNYEVPEQKDRNTRF